MSDKLSSPAVKRANELMSLLINQAPPLALEYVKVLAKKYGRCGEIYMTAYCDYAQIEEGLECTDDLYICKDKSIYADINVKAIEPPVVTNRLDDVV